MKWKFWGAIYSANQPKETTTRGQKWPHESPARNLSYKFIVMWQRGTQGPLVSTVYRAVHKTTFWQQEQHYRQTLDNKSTTDQCFWDIVEVMRDVKLSNAHFYTPYLLYRNIKYVNTFGSSGVLPIWIFSFMSTLTVCLKDFFGLACLFKEVKISCLWCFFW